MFNVIVHSERMEAFIEAIGKVILHKKNKIYVSMKTLIIKSTESLV